MSLDSNWIDSLLKAKPWRDLALRALVWFTVSGVAAYFALHRGLTPISFLDRVISSLAPIANAIGTFALLLTLPALALKDLESVSLSHNLLTVTRAISRRAQQ